METGETIIITYNGNHSLYWSGLARKHQVHRKLRLNLLTLDMEGVEQTKILSLAFHRNVNSRHGWNSYTRKN